MKMNLRTCLQAAALMMVFGCTSTLPPSLPASEAYLPEIDIVQVKENSDEAVKLSRESKLDIDAVNTKLIEIDNRLLVISEELSNLSVAKLEELENKVVILSEELRYLEQQLKITQKIKTTSEAPVFKNTFTPNPKPVHDVPQISETEAQVYKEASDLFYERKYARAIDKYDEIIKQYPKGTYADNAYFWSGECHFAMGNYAKAVASYSKIFTFSQTEKADDAQFKIGLAYLRMGDKDQASRELQKLLSLYPDSEYVGRAKRELKKIN